MNYAVRVEPCCESCGARMSDGPAEQTAAWLDGVCEQCWEESQATAERTRYAEGIADFRWLSRDWLKCHGCGGNALAGSDGEHGFCYCHKGVAAEAAFAARGENYRGTYDGRAQL